MEDKLFEVRMLGGFSIRYGGTDIVLGRNTTAKFIQLLQIVWLNGERGITKDALIRALYDKDAFSNINNSFNNLIYQMRKQMVKAGLPERNYIEKRAGLFVPDHTLDVQIDVNKFKEHIAHAEESLTGEEKAEWYNAALDIYGGELLPDFDTETWVVMENVALRESFDTAVNWLGAYYKDKEDYANLYRIYTKAADLYPVDDWQVGQIEALTMQGEYKDAFKLYNRIARYYNDDLGIPPTEKLIACYKELADKTSYEPGHVDAIREGLSEHGADDVIDAGAYYCPYPSFMDNYRIMSRNMKRGGQSIFMMMCTLVDYEGKQITNLEKLKTRSAVLKQAIQYALREGDAFTQYTNAQYLILLTGTTIEGCDVVYRRILHKLRELSMTKIDIRYQATSLAELDDTPEEALA